IAAPIYKMGLMQIIAIALYLDEMAKPYQMRFPWFRKYILQALFMARYDNKNSEEQPKRVLTVKTTTAVKAKMP
uniref:hypothetical protein n=1 Tax=Armatimonas sp. TaxID=1872638 RepID=UPI0037522281